VGFGEAAALAAERLAKGEMEKETRLRDKLINGVLKNIPDVILTGHRTARLPFHASFCFRYIEGESMLLRLDALGIGQAAARPAHREAWSPAMCFLL